MKFEIYFLMIIRKIVFENNYHNFSNSMVAVLSTDLLAEILLFSILDHYIWDSSLHSIIC